MLLKELTKELRSLKDQNLKEMSITDDVVSVFTRKGRTIEIDVKGLKEKEAVKEVVDKVSKPKVKVKK